MAWIDRAKPFGSPQPTATATVPAPPVSGWLSRAKPYEPEAMAPSYPELAAPTTAAPAGPKPGVAPDLIARSPSLRDLARSRNPQRFAEAQGLLDEVDFGLRSTPATPAFEMDQLPPQIAAPLIAKRDQAYKILGEILPADGIGRRWLNDAEAERLGVAKPIEGKKASDQTGKWYELDPATESFVLAEQEQANIAESIKGRGTGGVSGPIRGLQSAAGPVARVAEAAGLVEPGTADAGVRLTNAMAEEQAARHGGSTPLKYLDNAAQSVTQALVASPAGPYGVVGSFAASAGNEAYTEATDAGKTKSEARKFAADQAVIEGGITAAMQSVGLGGLESSFNRETLKPLSRATIGRVLKGLAAEQAEELMVATAGNMSRMRSQINPQNFGDLWGETFLQTAATMGLVNTPAAIRSGAKAWTDRNPEKAAAVASLAPGQATRANLAKAGIDTESEPSTLAERQAVVEQIKAEVARQQEYVEPPMPEVYPPNVVGMENGEPVFGPRVEKKPRGPVEPTPELSGNSGELPTPTMKPFTLPNPVTKWAPVGAGDMVAYDGRPFIVQARSTNGNKFDIYDDSGVTIKNVDRRHLDGYQKVPKSSQPLPDSRPNDAPLPETNPRFTPSQADVAPNPQTPVETAVPPVEQVAAPQPAAVVEPVAPPAPTIRETNPAKRAAVRSDIVKAFPGQKVVDLPEGGHRVELQNGSFLTVRRVDDLGPINREAAERTAGKKLSDEGFAKFKARGSWRISTPEGYETDGAGLMKLVNGDATDKTVRHETLHAARSLGLITPAEWSALVKKHAPDAKTDGDAEERIAQAYEAWKGPVGLWTRIKVAINRMLSALKIVNPTADTAATRLASGAVWARPARPETRSEAAARLSGDVRYAGSVAAEKSTGKAKPWEEFANPGETSEAKDAIDLERAARDENRSRDVGELKADAMAALSRDPSGVRKRLLEKMQSAGEGGAGGKELAGADILTGYEVLQAKKIIAEDRNKVLVDNDPAAKQFATDFLAAFDAQRSATGFALWAGRTQDENPAEYAGRILTSAVYGMPPEVAQRVREARKNPDRAAGLANAKKIAAEWTKKMDAIKAKMEKQGLLPSTKEGLDALLKDPHRAAHVANEAWARKNIWARKQHGWMDMFAEWHRTALMSGFKTAAANMSTLPNYTMRQVAEFVEAIGNKVTGDKDGAQLGEFAHLFNNFLGGVSLGWRNAVDSVKHEMPMFERRITGAPGKDLFGTKGSYAIPGKAGRVVRGYGYAPTMFGDEFQSSLVGQMEVNKQAYRIATKEKLTGDEFKERMLELTSDPSSVAWANAVAVANDVGFKGTAGPIAKQAIELGNKIKGLSYKGIRPFEPFIEFVNTPVHVLAEAGKWTPLHLPLIAAQMASNRWNKNPTMMGLKTEAVKALIGSAMVYAFMGETEDDEKKEGEFGVTTTKHPTNPSAFRWGDRYYSFKRWPEPFSSAMASIADMGHAWRHGKPVVRSALASVGNNIDNKAFLRGISDVNKVWVDLQSEEEKSAIESWLPRFAQSYEPNIVRQFVDAAQPNKKEDKHWGATVDPEQSDARLKRRFAEKLSFGLVQAADRFDRWGNPKSAKQWDDPTTDYMWRLFSPIETTETKVHPGDELLARWEDEHPGEGKIAELSPYYLDNGKQKSMTDKQFARYAELSGKIAAHLYKAGNYNPANPTKEQVASLERIFSAARDEAKDVLKREIKSGRQENVTAESLGDTLRRERLKSIGESLGSTYSPKRRAKETPDEFRERVTKERQRRKDLVQERLRLLGRTSS